jgi:hypothetical protein
VQVFTGAPVWMALMLMAMVLRALLGLHTRLAEFSEFSGVIAYACGAIFNHLQYFLSRKMSKACVYQEITFPFVQAFNPNFEKGQLAIVLMANFTFKKACFNFD